MNWNSTADFFAMGGYGMYVWGSVSVTAACILAEIIALQRRRKAALKRLLRELALNQDLSHEKSS